MKRIVILGSTGSIGASTLDVVSKFPDRFQVVGLAAGSNDQILEDQIRAFQPKVVALSCPDAAKRLRARLNTTQVEVLDVEPGLCEVARVPECDLFISA
ncbi:MAG: 1-deoxy-D-xylulose-5-phosphate reductoisomerase, partial [Nitrospirales bacterium]